MQVENKMRSSQKSTNNFGRDFKHLKGRNLSGSCRMPSSSIFGIQNGRQQMNLFESMLEGSVNPHK